MSYFAWNVGVLYRLTVDLERGRAYWFRSSSILGGFLMVVG